MPTLLHRRRRLAGLSRLEFGVVSIVVAVLMSLLLTRLGELPGLARPARLQGAMAEVRAAAQLFHARCQSLRSARDGERCDRITLDGVPVDGVHGWPAASETGIGRAAALPPADPRAYGALRLRAGERHGRPALYVALAERGCEFSYVQAAGPDASPEVDIVDASCQ